VDNKDVIIALDFATKNEVLDFLDGFNEKKPYVKIGMELYYGAGNEIVFEIKERGHKIFLDLKLHDIPNTIEKAMANMAKLPIDMINCHAGGTIEMMAAAQNGLIKGSTGKAKPSLIAVTLLTSISSKQLSDELLVGGSMEKTVIHYALNAKKAGLEGVVCSPLEAKVIKENCGSDFVIVTPGIRLDNDADDHKRINTPKQASADGAHYIVVGRPITAAEDPVAAYDRYLKEFVG